MPRLLIRTASAIPWVAFAARDGSRTSLLVATLTQVVVSLHQWWVRVPFLYVVAIGTFHIFAGFIFEQFAVLILVVTDITLIDLRNLVVLIVVEHRRRPLFLPKGVVCQMRHIVL